MVDKAAQGDDLGQGSSGMRGYPGNHYHAPLMSKPRHMGNIFGSQKRHRRISEVSKDTVVMIIRRTILRGLMNSKKFLTGVRSMMLMCRPAYW